MDGRSDTDEVDEAMLPGFRFHPTDEELVGFYLKRKVQQKPLSIELIRQLDIYKYDPWELPKLAAAGEKELYFYCPRDRKYRNSARPNRVTGGGFWKATGTDRPVYSSEGSKCIGLKKSLVFYKGRAARGIKTEWMMHELRLPSLTDPSLPKRPFDVTIPANDSWAICKIYKKTSSMAQRALSQSWASPLPEKSPRVMEAGSMIQFGCGNGAQLRATDFGHPQLEAASYKPFNLANSETSQHPVSNVETPWSSMFPSVAVPVLGDAANSSASVDYEGMHRCDGIIAGLPAEIDGNWGSAEEENSMRRSDQWGAFKAVRFPFKLPSNLSNGWGPNLFGDSGAHPSETATSYPTNDGFT